MEETKGNLAYCNHLFDETTDGYIQIMKFDNGECRKIYNTRNKHLRTIVEEVKGEKDIFISSNTYYRPSRSLDAIRQFRAFYIDLDLKKYEKAETIYMIYEMVEANKIPMPSMVIDSGRGIHLYWKIKNAPYGASYTWQELEDYLYRQLKHLDADIKATDGTRVLRLPGTINSRNNRECKVLIINDDIEYSMYDLREQYLNYKPKKIYTKKATVSNLFNSYSLHMARIRDIEKLCKLRNYDVENYRNFIIHCFAYWNGIYVREPEELKDIVFKLNNSFKKPLKDNEVQAVLRCIPKAIEKFIQYEQSLKGEEKKRVTKGMKDKGGYWYKNETLIDTLKITPEEEKQMKTIIGTEEKYKRNNERRNKARRNEEGLTKREQFKQNKVQVVKELKKQGFKQKEIAEKLGISKGTVSKYLKL